MEVLIPDFQGNWAALETVLDAKPEILNHNVETVPRLYRRVRPDAKYAQSLELLARARDRRDARALPMRTKSGADGRARRDPSRSCSRRSRTSDASGCDIATVGQYLQPYERRLPVERYYTPDEFAAIRERAEAMGFFRVESGPLVRSSYHARRALAPASPAA